MFVCYHIQKMHGFLSENLSKHMNHIGHVQIAAVPNRNEPLFGEINYKYIMSYLEKVNYKGIVGLEYLTKDDYPSATPITNREFEEAKQDMKRRIKLLDPRYVEDFVEEFKRLTQENVI